MDRAGAHHEVDFFKKCRFLVGRCFHVLFRDRGRFWKCIFLSPSRKKCEVENDAGGSKTYFPTDLGIIFCNFRQIFFSGRRGLGGYRILFLYIGTPDQPPLAAAIFHLSLSRNVDKLASHASISFVHPSRAHPGEDG